MSLTSNRSTVELADDGRIMVLPVAAGKNIFEGAMVAINATGYAVPASAAINLKVAGRAETAADNRTGADGETFVNIKRSVFIWENDSVAANKVTSAHLLAPCYIKDDCTVTAESTGTSPAGKVIAVYDDGTVAVELGI
ncbi:MAG: hypothetical protein RR131_09180 [Anaerovorax sp.]